MTIKEAFHQFLGFDVDSQAIALALLNAGLDGSAEYNASLKPQVERSTIDVLFQSIAVTSESESQYSTSKDAKLMRERLLYLARKYGRKDIVNAITGTVIVKNISRMR
ncbi:Uncharacterised protein [Sphingobacterium spiritivorum]|uniref:Uncharacterized protein n=1 Tax=Sphingobacterium spiritivorum TaxID=258 RepID=A0A380CGN5_SPHSI|nr:DUF6706 family protein [Sphingobacterium spiritivorum]SUJ19144.1 Uncharacterised protein [Sphingobacterium spiritivorum]